MSLRLVEMMISSNFRWPRSTHRAICAEREVLGPASHRTICCDRFETNNTRIDIPKLIEPARTQWQFGLVCPRGCPVQPIFTAHFDIAGPFRQAVLPVSMGGFHISGLSGHAWTAKAVERTSAGTWEFPCFACEAG